MTSLLQIDSSARTPRSHTRRLTRSFVQKWIARAPETRVIHRDLGGMPPPAITEQWIASAFTTEANRSTDQKAALAASDTYIDDLRHHRDREHRFGRERQFRHDSGEEVQCSARIRPSGRDPARVGVEAGGEGECTR